MFWKRLIYTRVMEMNEELKAIKYGQITAVAMIDRGSYANDELTDFDVRQTELNLLGKAVKFDNETFTLITRIDEFTPLSEIDLLKTTEKNLIFVDCLFLSTSEIKNFLRQIQPKLSKARVILMDLPQLEYLTLRNEFNL